MKTRLRDRVARAIDRPGYEVLIAVAAFCELFVSVAPMEGVLIPSAILRPKRKYRYSFAIALGSALGAAAIGIILQQWRPEFLLSLMAKVATWEHWPQVAHLFEEHGVLTLMGITLLPPPLGPIVAFCALIPMSPVTLALAVGLGRLVKYCAIAWAVTGGTSWIRGRVQKKAKG